MAVGSNVFVGLSVFVAVGASVSVGGSVFVLVAVGSIVGSGVFVKVGSNVCVVVGSTVSDAVGSSVADAVGSTASVGVIVAASSDVGVSMLADCSVGATSAVRVAVSVRSGSDVSAAVTTPVASGDTVSEAPDVGIFVKLLVARSSGASLAETTAVIAVGITSAGVEVSPDATEVEARGVAVAGTGAPTNDNTMPNTTANAITPIATTAINSSSPKSRCTFFSLRSFRREQHVKAGALPRLRLHPNLSVMHLNQRFRDRKPDACIA